MTDELSQASARVRVRQGQLCLRCSGRISDIHHRRRRAVIDPHTHCPCNLVGLCRTCHNWVHAHPKIAIETGWIVSVYEEAPSLVMVHSRYAPLLLLCDGRDRAVKGLDALLDQPAMGGRTGVSHWGS